MFDKTPTPLQKAMRKVMENREWIDTHIYELIEEFPGIVIALNNKQVVTTARDMEDMKDKLRACDANYDECCFIQIPREDVYTPPYPD